MNRSISRYSVSYIYIQRGYVINDSEYISLSHVIITVYNLMYV